MNVHVLGSSSSGNGYIITVGQESVILECGVPVRDALRAVGYDAKRVKAVFVSHRHGDHARYIGEYLSMFRCPFYSTGELTATHGDILSVKDVCNGWHPVRSSSFKFFAFPTKHDCESYGFVVRHPKFGNIFFGTDTYAYPAAFRGIDFWLIEANYDDKKIKNLDEYRKQRLLVSHMSINYCMKYLDRCHAELSKGIMLIHCSSDHSDAREFRERILKRFGTDCWIADKNLKVDII